MNVQNHHLLINDQYTLVTISCVLNLTYTRDLCSQSFQSDLQYLKATRCGSLFTDKSRTSKCLGVDEKAFS